LSEEEKEAPFTATDEELQMQQMYQQYGYPQAQPIYNVHKFLDDIAKAADTTKTGNLTEEELGLAPFTVRILKDVQAYCRMMGLNMYADYFGDKSEIVTASSLSKDGFLDKLAIMTRQQVEAISKKKKENKGWFKSKKSQQPEVTSLD